MLSVRASVFIIQTQFSSESPYTVICKYMPFCFSRNFQHVQTFTRRTTHERIRENGWSVVIDKNWFAYDFRDLYEIINIDIFKIIKREYDDFTKTENQNTATMTKNKREKC